MTTSETQQICCEKKQTVVKKYHVFSYFLLFLLMLPILLLILLVAIVYRFVMHRAIRVKYGDKLIAFLDGSDSMFSIADENAKSIINIMIFVEIKKSDYLDKSRNVIEELLLKTRQELSRPSILKINSGLDKLFYKLNYDYGYAFWTNDNTCTMEEYIRFLPKQPENDLTSKIRVQQEFSDNVNTSLPHNHTTTWEILFSQEVIDDNEKSAEDDLIVLLPVIYRFNHTVGDGIAILRIILESLVDDRKHNETVFTNGRTTIGKSDGAENFFSRCLDKLKILLITFYIKLYVIVNTPAYLLKTMMFKKTDRNGLHDRKLCGAKIISWYFEQEDDGNLMTQIKSIKKNQSGIRFSDVLLTAASNSLEKFYLTHKFKVPETITCYLPVRIEDEDEEVKLKNKFSVASQVLPLKSTNANSLLNFHNKLTTIKENTDLIRKTPLLLITYGIMSLTGKYLPGHIAGPILGGTFNGTLIVSNLPGPNTIEKFQGFRLRNASFLIPNFGQSGLGVTIVSYGNRLQFGLIADKMIINSLADADSILLEIVNQIKIMSRKYQEIEI